MTTAKRAPDWLQMFRADGCAVIPNLTTPEQALAVITTIGATVTLHPDADPSGITRITSDGRHERHNGRAFSTRGLYPHTDRSGATNPPRVLLTVNHKPAAEGGHATIVNAERVLNRISGDLAAKLRHPECVRTLAGNPAREVGFPLFVADPFLIRFRADGDMHFPGLSSDELVQLLEAINAETVELRLKPDEGLLLDNHRWLHGRTAFTGEREVWRVLAD